MRDFRELKVWQSFHEVTLEVYRLTAQFPESERYGLTSQLRRSAASMGANIAEGCGRDSEPDFVKYLIIASGSASETCYHLLLARDLGFITEPVYDEIIGKLDRTRRMLTTLIRRLRPRPPA